MLLVRAVTGPAVTKNDKTSTAEVLKSKKSPVLLILQVLSKVQVLPLKGQTK